MQAHHLFLILAALAIGLLIGIERGWHAREKEEGARVAGVRTFALIGLLGGITGILTNQLGSFALGFIFIGFAGLISISYAINIKRREDIGITSLIAALLTFLLGCLATMGYVVESASAAIITALLLRLKPILHEWIKKIESKELMATLELLLISVVLLSILPNQTFGPWQAFNPFEIWWMVVLIALISYIGYFAIKLFGTQKGIFFTALFAGLLSSTALTLHFARLSKKKPHLNSLLSMGILIACGMMFFRMLFVLLILNPSLFKSLLLPGTLMGSCLIIIAFVFWRQAKKQSLPTSQVVVTNPLALKSALFFGGVLSIVTVLTKGVSILIGPKGLLAFSAISGLADVDAIVLSLSRLSADSVESTIITTSILLAAVSNTFLKAILASSIGNKSMIIKTSLPLCLIACLGLGLIFFDI